MLKTAGGEAWTRRCCDDAGPCGDGGVLAGYLLALLPALTFFGLLYVQSWLPMASLIRDPVAIFGGQFYHGLVSNIGILLWCAAAAICLFRGAENWRAGFRRRGGFLLSAGLLTSMLLLDDFFLVHEQMLPRLTGMPEKLILIFYPIAVVLYTAAWWREIVRADAALLLLSLTFFAISNLIDVAFDYHFYEMPAGPEVSVSVILEEGAKFIGIAAWAVFHIRAAWMLGPAEPSGRTAHRD
jgi:hypothetical protein